MKNFILIPILSLCLFACENESSKTATSGATDAKTTETSTTNTEGAVPEGLTALVNQAKALGDTPTAIRKNFGSGYWHLGAAVNTTEVGKNVGYEGVWFQLHESHLLTVGKEDDVLYQGAWAWDEEPQMLTFLAPLKDDWWINEWKTINRGDLYVCMGNTPNNKRSTQFKLVRKQSKKVD